MIGEAQTYRRCLVLAGGGGRLGVHLGTHAAACEAGLAPDVVLGTCGGALVAALVHVQPDPGLQLDWLSGPGMHRFWCAVRAREPAGLGRAAAGLARRLLDPRRAPRVPDLDADALFEAAGPWPDWAWRDDGAGPDAVLLGARLAYDRADIGDLRAGRALFAPVAIGPARATALLRDAPAATGTGAHAGSAVAPTIAVAGPAELGLADAVRVSMTDMVYLPPAGAGGARWLGGAVDLMPVELAARLAAEVWIDRKDPIPRWTMAPAWRAVLGIAADQRQREVDAAPVALRIDHRGLGRALPDAVLHRRLAFGAGAPWPRLGLRACADAGDYRRVVHAQFDEGRRRARAALAARGGSA